VSEAARDQFEAMFGTSWDETVAKGDVLNAAQAMKRLGLDGFQLQKGWNDFASNRVKLASGTYVQKFETDGIWVVNGFYAGMREEYIAPGQTVHWFVVSWDVQRLSWQQFRVQVIGATDPAAALHGSLRAKILKSWQALKLVSQPDMQHNAIHASAGPIEALKERMVWLDQPTVFNDPFAKAMIRNGVSQELLQKWLGNTKITMNAQTSSVFDLTENKNTAEVHRLALDIQAMRNEL